MRDLNRALSDITSIRSHLAAGTMFQGFGPAVMAATGTLAAAVAAAQLLWPAALAADPATYLFCWLVAAVIAAGLIGGEMVARSRRHHGGLADTMIANALWQFVPAGVVGAVLTFVLLQFAPQTLWLLPGLWQILIALGLAAAVRSLPRAVGLVGLWYFGAGIVAIIVASSTQTLTPWLMGVPFAFGQFLMAGILFRATGGNVAEDD